MKPIRALALAVGFALAAAASPPPAHAESAATLKQAGIKAAKNKDWVLARTKFDEAYRLDPQPLTLFNLATAQQQTDELIAARASFVTFLDKTIPGEHDRFRKLAKEAIANLSTNIPTLRVKLEGFTASVVVEIDGRALSSSQLAAPVPVDPGTHTIAALRGSTELVRRTIAVGRGARDELVLPAPPPPATEPARPIVGTTARPGPTPPPPPPRDEGGVLSSGWFWLATSVIVLGGAGAGYYYVLSDAPTAPTTRGTLGGGGLTVP